MRLRIGFLLVSMVLSVFAVRLFQLQGVDAQAYGAKARAEGVVTVGLPATRGTITDRNGVPLANSVDGMMLVADPTVTVKHASDIATIIARRLDVDYFDVLARLRKPMTQFQYIARRVPATRARAVLAAIDPGPGAQPYVCGPTGFVEHAIALLLAAGHDPSCIAAERFGPS